MITSHFHLYPQFIYELFHILYFNFRRFHVNTFLVRPRMRLSQERALDFGIYSALVYQRAYKELGIGILK